MKRVGNIIMGLLFILLSLFFQCLFLSLLLTAVLRGLFALGIQLQGTLWPLVIFCSLLVTVNAIACWEYFCKGRGRGSDAKNSAVVFMIPKALDLIWNG